VIEGGNRLGTGGLAHRLMVPAKVSSVDTALARDGPDHSAVKESM
jgi:hypothetical protein